MKIDPLNPPSFRQFSCAAGLIRPGWLVLASLSLWSTLTPLWAQELKFSADFEAPSYLPGSIHGQQGWSVDQGKADVLPGRGFQESAGLVLRPILPFSQARLSLEAKNQAATVSFVDLKVRPIASDVLEKAELLDINSARIGLFREGASKAAVVWVFDGDGNGGGGWVETAVRIPVDPNSGLTQSWHRLTVREDIRRQTWDLWLDGVWLAAGLGFQDPRPTEAATFILMGDCKEPVALDDLGISRENPLGTDGDGDGLTDETEKLLGFDPSRDDRDEDADGDGQPNLDDAVKQSGKQNPEPLTAARRVVALPEWSVPPGLLADPVRLELKSSTAGVAIRYTMDGSDPRTSGPGVREFAGPIEVSGTTIIKAAARTTDGRWSAVAAGAWIFADQVLQQQRPGGWPETFEDVAADRSPLRLPVPYEMKLNGARDENQAALNLAGALNDAPVVVLMADPVALMGETDGLYSKASGSAGRRLENVGVQVNVDGGTKAYAASLSLSGSSSRYHDVTLKHSLRLQFGQSRSGGDGLPGTGYQLLLRNPTQDSWTVGGRWSGLRSSARYFADGMADQWLADRGHAHLGRRWVHVFLNQVYWGLYEAVEQLGPESTGGTLLEGTAAAGTVPIYGAGDAWRKLMTDARSLARKSAAGHETGPAWQEVLTRLDAAGLADYIALNLWLGNKDWPNRNYLISSHGDRFRFLSWDAEYVMPVQAPVAAPQLVEILDASDGPAALFSMLCEAPAFRQVLRQRLAEAAGFHDGAFAALLVSVSDRFRPLLPAEAARWGSYYDPKVDHAALWDQNVKWIAQSWIPGRASDVRKVLMEHLERLEGNQAAAAIRLASQKDLPPPATEPVAFIAVVPEAPADRDGDGLPDAWELAHGLNPDDPSDAAADPDGDGIDNLAEYRRRLDPHRKDAPAKPSPTLRTGAFNRMEQPVIRRGRIVDQVKADEMKLSIKPKLAPVESPPLDTPPSPGKTP